MQKNVEKNSNLRPRDQKYFYLNLITYGTIDDDGYDNFPLTIVSTLFKANRK